MLARVSSNVSKVGSYSFDREAISSKTRQYIVRYVYFINDGRVVKAREDNLADTKVNNTLNLVTVHLTHI